MIALLRFVASNAWLISLVCVLGAGRYLWKALTIHRAGQATPYALERESATVQIRRAWMLAVALAVIGVIVGAGSPLVLDYTADESYRMTPALVAGILTVTPMPTATPTPAPTPVAPTPTVQAVVAIATVTATPPDQTPTPAPTPVPPGPDCPDPRVQLGAPVAGQLLSGVVEIWGTADIPDFNFYKFEIRGPFTAGEWQTVGEMAHTPVSNGLLGYWDAGPVAHAAPGVYLFRLVVVDNTGNYPAPCVVQVRIALE